MNNKAPNIIHPGEILKLEFLEPLEITAYKLSKDIQVSQTRISEIIQGKRSISADTALRLSRYFGTTPEFWLNLQAHFDLTKATKAHARDYEKIPMAQFDNAA
ncbi:HigA family addiction module antitoxin [Thermosynechococcaceae cyanobacterium BACA0444]|uniref:HigA family addiction module antitoxin n=1 Tax=Pseudocalidococcus azoricus BACA0444 TaxID=2918990 RepID=A0AAE4FT00_9CYAN|nr:HigA family addiction module antitoxin [Pseudocalidococcus azoricus]MDS3860992.1 HigA family addiction module antitoxin [Pseudocalidococcus azoricus BACA0444]